MKTDSLPEVLFYKPDNDIQWIVRKFEIIKYDCTSCVLTDSFIPRPDVALVFNFRSIPEVNYPDNIILKPLFIATIPVKPLQLYLKDQVNSFIVICNASVLSRVLKINLINSVPLIEISDYQLLHLWRKLSVKKTDMEKINCISDYLNNLIPDEYHPDIIDNIYNDIINTCLQKPLNAITENKCCSTSSLQRNFLKRTGVSMKKLIRIARVHTIFEMMLKQKQFDFRKMFYESNYYDQSHFIKDFKEITGRSPMQFFKQNTELLRIISGMENYAK